MMNASLSEVDEEVIMDFFGAKEGIICVSNSQGIKIYFGSGIALQLTFDEDKLVEVGLDSPYDQFNEHLMTSIYTLEQMVNFCTNIERIATQECMICNSIFPLASGPAHEQQSIFNHNINVDKNILQIIRNQGPQRFHVSKSLVNLIYTHQEVQPTMIIKTFQRQYNQVLDEVSVSSFRCQNLSVCDALCITDDGQIVPYHSECMQFLQI